VSSRLLRLSARLGRNLARERYPTLNLARLGFRLVSEAQGTAHNALAAAPPFAAVLGK
jgi:hypothetical protein